MIIFDNRRWTENNSGLIGQWCWQVDQSARYCCVCQSSSFQSVSSFATLSLLWSYQASGLTVLESIPLSFSLEQTKMSNPSQSQILSSGLDWKGTRYPVNARPRLRLHVSSVPLIHIFSFPRCVNVAIFKILNSKSRLIRFPLPKCRDTLDFIWNAVLSIKLYPVIELLWLVSFRSNDNRLKAFGVLFSYIRSIFSNGDRFFVVF